MRMIKRIAALMLAVSMIMCLGGCGKTVEFRPKESGLFIRSDRTIVSAEIEPFDNSQFDTPRYSESELLTFAEDLVKQFNQEQAGMSYAYAADLGEKSEEKLPVAIQSLKVEGKKAELLLEYQNFKYYLDFNGTTSVVPVQNLIVGTVQDGVNSGLDFSGMSEVEKGAVTGTADAAEIAENSKLILVSITGNTTVTVEGTIRYLSSDLTFVDDNTVKCTGANQYIIFK